MGGGRGRIKDVGDTAREPTRLEKRGADEAGRVTGMAARGCRALEKTRQSKPGRMLQQCKYFLGLHYTDRLPSSRQSAVFLGGTPHRFFRGNFAATKR